MKNIVQDDYFGVDVKLENINKSVFISKNVCNDSSNGPYKKKKDANANISVPFKKGKKKGSTKNPVDDIFSKHMERFYDIYDGTN